MGIVHLVQARIFGRTQSLLKHLDYILARAIFVINFTYIPCDFALVYLWNAEYGVVFD